VGSIWLTDLDRWLIDAGLDVSVYDNNWKTRSRSSGGYEDVRGIGIHHDASSTGSSEQSACDWGWKNSSDKPIGAIRIGRSGHITIGAAGATNTMGKGGPLNVSRGTIPKDQGNLYMVAIEAANNGIGEAWGTPMLDAYLLMVWTLCDRLGLKHSDVYGHAGYCQPSCPGRKIDPAGPTPGYPNLGNTTGAKTWPDSAFRGYLDKIKPYPPDPSPPKPGTDWRSVGATYSTPPRDYPMQRYGQFDNTEWLQAVLCSMDTLPADGGKPIYNPAWVGYDSKAGVPNGRLYYADATHNALAYWQSKNGLTADGKWGPATADKMYKVRGK